MRALLLLPLLATACGNAPLPSAPAPMIAACPALPQNPETIAVPEPIPGELHEVFDLPDEPALWAPAPNEPAREQYRQALLDRIGNAEGLTQRATLLRVQSVMAGDAQYAPELQNVHALLEGKAGTIKPISCLEWRLFQRQADRYPMLSHPTELGAHILVGKARVRVYFSSADRVGAKLRGEVRDRVVADVAQGMAPLAHFHNHPFFFDRKVGDRMWTTEATVNNIEGAIAPSLTDVQAYRSMREHFGLQGAWVTNGLDTAHYSAKDFDVLSARENAP